MQPIHSDLGLTFDQARHLYHWNGWPLESVTTFIRRFHTPFDTQAHSARVAARERVDQSKVIERWRRKADAASELGTAVHAEAERVANSIVHRRSFDAVLGPGLSGRPEGYIRALWRFFLDHGELFYGDIAAETRVCHPVFGLAGTVDLLCNLDGVPAVVDFKTSESIKFEGYGPMLAPLEALPDCNFIHYGLQLSTYSRNLRDRYDYDARLLALVNLKPSGKYELLYVPEMEWAVDAMLCQRPGPA